MACCLLGSSWMHRQRWRRLPRRPARKTRTSLLLCHQGIRHEEGKPIAYSRKTILCLWLKDHQLGFTTAGLSNVHWSPETNQPASTAGFSRGLQSGRHDLNEVIKFIPQRVGAGSSTYSQAVLEITILGSQGRWKRVQGSKTPPPVQKHAQHL